MTLKKGNIFRIASVRILTERFFFIRDFVRQRRKLQEFVLLPG
jgi:hypothetical protein